MLCRAPKVVAYGRVDCIFMCRALVSASGLKNEVYSCVPGALISGSRVATLFRITLDVAGYSPKTGKITEVFAMKPHHPQ